MFMVIWDVGIEGNTTDILAYKGMFVVFRNPRLKGATAANLTLNVVYMTWRHFVHI